ncbi:hypothetical protein KUTeg_004728 [Tegillarca granosa]|uniref:Caspase family p20 domain-containing protein n=1 Tax=Tegillarca granosa TaxID=220873 RepID=A0ABQ9FHQ9_TEGGR|nr:hypothetical protein KUTeg_004728 [Tegillarca granosa]
MPFKEFEAKEYNMKHKQTGRAIVINNKNFRRKIRNSDERRTRENTDQDRDAIKKVLERLGFVGINYKDQKTKGTKQEMIFENVQKEELLKLLNDAGDDTINKYDDMDCFICVILSYGEPGVVYCPGANNTDRDDLVELKKLMEPLKGNRCRGLLMKPKLFFIQGCPYEYYDEANYGKTETKKEIIKKVPVEADFLIQSCHLDASFGTLGKGQKTSWFIRALCEALQTFCIDEMKNSQEKRSLHFLTVLTRDESQNNSQYGEFRVEASMGSLVNTDTTEADTQEAHSTEANAPHNNSSFEIENIPYQEPTIIQENVRFDFKVDMSLNQSDDRQSQPDASASTDDYRNQLTR